MQSTKQFKGAGNNMCLDSGTPAPPPPPPCSVEPAKSKPFCDYTLPLEQRVANLISLIPDSDKINLFNNNAGGIASLNIPPYQWWSEALHVRAVVTDSDCLRSVSRGWVGLVACAGRGIFSRSTLWRGHSCRYIVPAGHFVGVILQQDAVRGPACCGMRVAAIGLPDWCVRPTLQVWRHRHDYLH